MTNEEIDGIIRRSERGALVAACFAPSQVWRLCGIIVLQILFLAASMSNTVAVFECFLLLCSSIAAMIHGVMQFKRKRVSCIWNCLWTGPDYIPKTRELRQIARKIEKIYQIENRENLLTLRQSVQVFNIYYRQQIRLQEINKQLDSMLSLRENLTTKISQLQSLGGTHIEALQKLDQAAENYKELRRIQTQIQNSCARLEEILASVEDAANARQLRRELDELSASLPQRAETIEPAFAVESLEDIERQIGREIETYLQLERETEEHLR